MDDRLVTIAEFENPFEAQVAKAALEDNGISAAIMGEKVQNLLPADGMLNVQLKVFAADEQKASEVLGSLSLDKTESGGDDK